MIEKAPSVPEASQRGVDLLEKIASFEMPSQADYINSLSTMHLAIAILLFACGLAYLLRGWKIFKILVVVNAAVLGGFLGSQLGQMLLGENMPLFVAIALALLFAVLSWPLMKFAVSLMGGLAGSFLGYGVWNYVASAVGRPVIGDYAWAGALIGLIALGLLAFVIFRMVVLLFTSIQGSLMTVSGLIAMLMQLDTLRPKLRSALEPNVHLLALLIAVPAVIGFAFQYNAVVQKSRKKRKAMEKDS